MLVGWMVYAYDDICCCCCKLIPKCCAVNYCDGPCGSHPAVFGDTCTCNEVSGCNDARRRRAVAPRSSW